MVMESWNHSDDLRTTDFALDGAFHGTGYARMFGDQQQFTRMRFQPARNPGPGDASGRPASDGLLRGNLAIRTGHQQVTAPLLFLTEKESGNVHYQYDFEREGISRLGAGEQPFAPIASPADGGRVLALRTTTSDNLISLGGALHDFVVPEGTAPQQAGCRGISLTAPIMRSGSKERRTPACG